jgi:lipopolysaccharide transport system permease protein
MQKDKWLFEISPKNNLFDLNLKEVWKYRDLLLLFVKRDVVTLYKQTILGPLWYLIQPLFTSLIFTLVFNNIAGIETGKIPSFLFNLAGITAWNYFKDCLTATSDTFKKNEAIFGKVYFPRVIMPMAIIISNLIKFGIQLLIFASFYLYYVYKGLSVDLSLSVLYMPLLVLAMGLIGLGSGMIISSMVTKYRDLTFLVTFGIQLLMYLSAVMYSTSELKEKLVDYPLVAKFIDYNPLAKIIESFRRIVFIVRNEFTNQILIVDLKDIFFVLAVSFFIFLLGLVIFNKTEKTFIDTI